MGELPIIKLQQCSCSPVLLKANVSTYLNILSIISNVAEEKETEDFICSFATRRLNGKEKCF